MLNELISVIIPTYGRSLMLKRALKSVRQQTYKSIEIIVVDDNNPGSKDRQTTEKLMEECNDILYIKHEKNLGGCSARNTGIKHSNGNYIAFLDDDDEWNKDFASKQIEKFDNKNIGAVYCNFYLHKTDQNKTYSQKIKFLNFKGEIFNQLISGWSPASTSLFVVKKECFEKCGYFDEELSSFQDYDMWLRIAKLYEFNYSNEYLAIKHEHQSGQISLNPNSRKKGLDSLKNKWLSTFENEDKKTFLNTINTFEKEILYIKFVNSRDNKEIMNSVKYLIRYNKIDKIYLIPLVKMMFILIFGYVPFKLLHRYNAKKSLKQI